VLAPLYDGFNLYTEPGGDTRKEGGARPNGLIVRGYVPRSSYRSLHSADRVESLVLQGRLRSSPCVHRAFVSGCEGSSIAVLCSVASRVAREIYSNWYLQQLVLTAIGTDSNWY